MNHKRRKEMEEIALNVYRLLQNSKNEQQAKAADEDCCVKAVQTFNIDTLSKNELFSKIVKKLPVVYNEANPYELYSLHEWLKRLTRNDLVSPNLKEESIYFDELSLTDIKRYFAAQLQNHYYSEYNRVKALHINVLKNYYRKGDK